MLKLLVVSSLLELLLLPQLLGAVATIAGVANAAVFLLAAASLLLSPVLKGSLSTCAGSFSGSCAARGGNVS